MAALADIQRLGSKDVINRMLFPRHWCVGAEHNLAGADLCHQMAQTCDLDVSHPVENLACQMLAPRTPDEAQNS
jgi:hypothetical protein